MENSSIPSFNEPSIQRAIYPYLLGYVGSYGTKEVKSLVYNGPLEFKGYEGYKVSIMATFSDGAVSDVTRFCKLNTDGVRRFAYLESSGLVQAVGTPLANSSVDLKYSYQVGKTIYTGKQAIMIRPIGYVPPTPSKFRLTGLTLENGFLKVTWQDPPSTTSGTFQLTLSESGSSQYVKFSIPVYSCPNKSYIHPVTLNYGSYVGYLTDITKTESAPTNSLVVNNYSPTMPLSSGKASSITDLKIAHVLRVDCLELTWKGTPPPASVVLCQSLILG